MNIFLILTLFVTISFAKSNLFDDINQKIKAIEQSIHTHKAKSIKVDYDPFIVSNKVEKKDIKAKSKPKITPAKNKRLHLSMIFNKKAFISGKWYKEKDRLNDYMISKINSNNVILRKKSKTIVLKLSSSRNVLKIED